MIILRLVPFDLPPRWLCADTGVIANSGGGYVNFQLQQNAQEKSLREASLALESARLDLGVILFRDFNEKFEIVDDLRLAPPDTTDGASTSCSVNVTALPPSEKKSYSFFA